MKLTELPTLDVESTAENKNMTKTKIIGGDANDVPEVKTDVTNQDVVDVTNPTVEPVIQEEIQANAENAGKNFDARAKADEERCPRKFHVEQRDRIGAGALKCVTCNREISNNYDDIF